MRAIVFEHLGRSAQAQRDRNKATQKCYIPVLLGATVAVPKELGIQYSK